MKKFIKNNWFEVGVLIIGVLIVVALFSNGGAVDLNKDLEKAESDNPSQQASVSDALLNGDKSTSTATSSDEYYEVLRVIDGDTVVLEKDNKKETVRLIGVDSPEREQCFYDQASNKMNSLISGKEIAIKKDITQGDRDIYNRLLAYLYTKDGTLVNKEMIDSGHAREYTYDDPYIFQGSFKAAESQAKENNIGFWKEGVCDNLWEN